MLFLYFFYNLNVEIEYRINVWIETKIRILDQFIQANFKRKINTIMIEDLLPFTSINYSYNPDLILVAWRRNKADEKFLYIENKKITDCKNVLHFKNRFSTSKFIKWNT
jgi:hypothetical protein